MKIRILDGNSIIKEIKDIDLLEELLLSLIEDKEEEEVEEEPKYDYKELSLADILPDLKVSKVMPEQTVKYFGEDLVSKDDDFDRNLFDVYRDVLSDKKETKEDTVNYMDFSEALKLLKLGQKLARKGWNGKDMYVIRVNPIKSVNPKNASSIEIDLPKYNPYFTIKNMDNSISVWVPSVGDTLAEDWYVVK